MGALIMFGMVIVIANVGGLYFLMHPFSTEQVRSAMRMVEAR